MKGTVYLVGAGPGDPGLMTLRGAELLRQAEVVVYDGLVNPALLALAGEDAELIYGGKHDRERAVSQEDLNRLLVEKAAAGKRVVRLKGGDPYVFGRGGEEAKELALAHIPFEVVPGVSSAEAVPSYAGIPVTHRDFASSYTVVTGQETPDRPEERIDWRAMARTPGTLVILMGLTQLRKIADELVSHGRPGDTPTAVIRWGATGRQRSWVGTLATIADTVERSGVQPPATIVVGEVVRLRSQLNWFEHRPLLGQRIVVTRARDQAAQLSGPLRELGADVIEVPTIRFGPPTERTPILEALAGINAYDWIVFTSANGVTAFFDLFFQGFPDLRDLGGVRVAAVGPGTAARLRELHLQVDLVPPRFAASEVAAAMRNFESLENLKILLPRAEKSNPELPRLLEELGAIVDDVGCYRTEPETRSTAEADRRLLEAGADWLTFTSGSTIEHFHRRLDLPRLLAKYPAMRIATIGPETTQALAGMGLKPAVEAKPTTIEGLVAAVRKASVPAGKK